MSIIRLIYITVQPNQVKDAVSLWKNQSARRNPETLACLAKWKGISDAV